MLFYLLLSLLEVCCAKIILSLAKLRLVPNKIWASLPQISLHRCSLTQRVSAFACLCRVCFTFRRALEPAARSSSPFWARGTFQESCLPHALGPEALSPQPRPPRFNFSLVSNPLRRASIAVYAWYPFPGSFGCLHCTCWCVISIDKSDIHNCHDSSHNGQLDSRKRHQMAPNGVWYQ